VLRSGSRVRDERGVVFPSPVVMLSIIAVAMAGIAFVATRGQDSGQQDVTTVAGVERHHDASQAPAAQSDPKHQPKAHEAKPKKHHHKKPAVQRGKVYVEVYNNSGISGLAGQVASRASTAGWNVVGSDNWYGTIPASTVYYPQRLEPAAKMLAHDLGIRRVVPAVDPMRLDRLTVILTGALA
jgi:hypothetical protein